MKNVIKIISAETASSETLSDCAIFMLTFSYKKLMADSAEQTFFNFFNLGKIVL